MDLPRNVYLPFFAYGAFRPGQLAFHRLKPFVLRTKQALVRGQLRIRDGLPILDPDGAQDVSGSLFFFGLPPEAACQNAYRAIVDLEPGAQYRWAEITLEGSAANVLFGKSPKKGSVPAEDQEWDGRKDPLFTAGLDVVRETLEANRKFEWDLRPMFRLQMAYLLLWSAVERYVSLRHHLGANVTDKVMKLGAEPAFAEALRSVAPQAREVYRADRPQERLRLDPNDPNGSLSYYYQIRSNIVHRGKGVPHDHDRVLQSLDEFLSVFLSVLQRAFEEARLDA